MKKMDRHSQALVSTAKEGLLGENKKDRFHDMDEKPHVARGTVSAFTAVLAVRLMRSLSAMQK